MKINLLKTISKINIEVQAHTGKPKNRLFLTDFR